MNREETRKELLELLAKGKISIDEAVTLLDQTASETAGTKVGDEVPLKVDVDVDIDVEKETLYKPDIDLDLEEYPLPAEKLGSKEPRWLRIHVGDLETGKSKVRVNVPFGMVKFGLNVAQFFAPQEYSDNLDQVATMMAESESGLLVDVQDDESNEHVRIYFD